MHNQPTLPGKDAAFVQCQIVRLLVQVYLLPQVQYKLWNLGVSSEKINRWFKDICQISTDPPSPHLILDIFILDKFKLVFTPLPLPKFGQKQIFLYKFWKTNFYISSLLFFLLLEDFLQISFS